MIEEFMLAANECVARMLSASSLNFLRRVHEPPELRKQQALTTFIRDLGIECESLESRFEVKRVIAAVAGQPEEHAVNYAVLRSMQKAVYAPSDEGHYALNKEHYCHFTSPIRRYPDLTIHRMIETLARGKRPVDDIDRMIVLGDHCSEREQRAEGAERELIKVKLLMYLSKRIGETLDAVITGVEDFGLFAQGVELPAEGLIHVDTLNDDFYRYDSATHSLAGYRSGNRYRLGDRVRVEVARVDIDRRQLDLRIVKHLGHPERRRARRPPADKRRRGGDREQPAAATNKVGRRANRNGNDRWGSRRVSSRLWSWELLAEERIQAAQAEGQFDCLPGFGRPIPGIDEPHDELWWVKDKLKREQISSLPPALAIRLDAEKTLARIASLTVEDAVRREVESFNKRIRKASFAIVWGPPVDVVPLDVEETVARWRSSRRADSPAVQAGVNAAAYSVILITLARASGWCLSLASTGIGGPNLPAVYNLV